MIVRLTLWGEEARRAEEYLGFEKVGDKKRVPATIIFEFKPAGGKSRVDLNVTF